MQTQKKAPPEGGASLHTAPDLMAGPPAEMGAHPFRLAEADTGVGVDKDHAARDVREKIQHFHVNSPLKAGGRPAALDAPCALRIYAGA